MLNWTVDFTGIPDGFDKEAAQLIIDQENEKRAAQDPPGTPLPHATGAELKASYLTVLVGIIGGAHESYKQQAAEKSQQTANVKELWKSATPAQRQAAVAALTP